MILIIIIIIIKAWAGFVMNDEWRGTRMSNTAPYVPYSTVQYSHKLLGTVR